MKKTNKKEAESTFQKRRRFVLSRIKGEAALFFSAPEAHFTRDQYHPYRQNSDLFYLSGIEESSSALLLLGNSSGPRSVLFLNKRDEQKEKWEKGPMGLLKAKRTILVDEVRPISELPSQLAELTRFAQVIHYAPGTHPDSDEIIWRLLQNKIGPRVSGPHTLVDSRLITSEMRVKKDRNEIRTLKHVADISAESFCRLAPQIPRLKSELHAARVLESEFSALGADSTAFATIVASGKNATVLHHSPTFQPLWKKGLVLIDAGASFQGYSADMTRTLPVAGTFSPCEGEVYDIVLSAFQAAAAKAKPGKSLNDMHGAAYRTLCKGLKEIGVLKGTLKTLLKQKAYLPYFMHRTGHWLGIDVHDIAPIYYQGKLLDSYRRPLESGNLITIEPGLYFDPKDQSIPPELRGLGIRIEDSVLITADGHELLTSRMPKDRKEIEQLIQSR